MDVLDQTFGHDRRATEKSCRKPFWAFPRSASVIRAMVEVGTEHGWSARDCLLGSGLQPETLQLEDLEVDARQELCVVRNLVYLSDDRPGLGADVGRRITLGMLGIWGLAMVTSSTTRSMVEISHRFGRLSWLFLRPWVDVSSGPFVVVYDGSDVPADVRDFLVERDMASSISVVPSMFGASVPLRVTTTLEPRRGRALSAALPGWDVRFDHQLNSIEVDPGFVDLPMPYADPYTRRRCELYCAELELKRRRRISGEVRDLLAATPRLFPSPSEVALLHHVDERTLRRQLAAEGTSYRSLIDETREYLAVEWLRTQRLSTEEVAHRLAFSDSRSFRRAFKRWTGRPPGSLLNPAVAAGEP